MKTFKKNNGDAAYTVVRDVTAEEAADKGYVVVEYSMTNPPTPIFGYYNHTESGGALDVTVPADATTQVVSGGVGASATSVDAGDKGALVNPNDPVIHGTGEQDIHADGSPGVDRHEQQEKLADMLAETPEEAAKAKAKAK